MSALQRQGIVYRLKGDYVGATRVSDRLKQRFPDDAMGYTFNLNTLITRFSWDLSDKQFDSDINKDARFALAICESRIGSDPSDYRAFHHCGQAHFALAYLHAARGHYYRAGTNGSATIEYLEKALALAPDLTDAKLHLGVAYYYADHLPSFVKMFSRLLWFVPTGNSDKSLRHVKEVTENGKYFKDVAKYLYSDLLMNGDALAWQQAGKNLKYLVAHYPQSRRIQLRYIAYLVQQELYAESVIVAEKFMRGDECCPRDPVDIQLARLWKVRAYLGLHSVDLAVSEFAKIGPRQRSDFPSWGRAWYALTEGQVHDLSLNRSGAIQAYRRVLLFDREGSVSADLAEAAAAGLQNPFSTQR